MGSDGPKRDNGSFFKRLRRVATTEIENAPKGSEPGICSICERAIKDGV